MSGPTELRPVHGACRHLRGRYKLEHQGRNAFPEMVLLRYECEQGREIETEEDAVKCVESVIECWQE